MRGYPDFPLSTPYTTAKMAPKKFRCNARQFFLTYPQASCDHQALYDYLINKEVHGDKPDLILVAKELHQDGNPHYHCYLKYKEKKDVKNEKLFDCFGLHPNIQSVRSVKAVLKYVIKDDNYLANFEPDIKLPLSKILERATDEKSFMDLCLKHHDFKFAASFGNVMAWYRKQRQAKIVCEPLFSLDTFKLLDIELLTAINSVICHQKDGSRTKSIWLSGPSRYGKSGLARSLGEHSYMQNLWNLDNLSDEATYLVLDDLNWDSWKYQYKSILGCQLDVTFTGKYRAPKTFRYNMPCIVCTNVLPTFTLEELNWMMYNVVFIEIKNRLY
jgi:hypothetical protein